MGAITILPETTKTPLQVIGRNAGICWNSNIEDREKNIRRAYSCINSGHGRVLEYVDIHLVLSGYSARVIREWYTHIGGSPTRLQESTRYVNEGNFEYTTPPSVSKNAEILGEYSKTMIQIKEQYEKLLKLGVSKEDAALVLPLGMSTKIVDKRNLRNLIEMSHQRMCSRAYWEFRDLMTDICKALQDYSNEWYCIVDEYFKPKCEFIGYCTEEKSCGRKMSQEKFKEIIQKNA